ncbi:MAG: DUF1996 domain-containing protein [Actinomycetota bacterium]
MRRGAAALCLIVVASMAAPARADGPAIGQFVVRCGYSHSLPDDPIVLPGQPGASHLHDFFGNTTTDAFSSQASLLAGQTTCAVPSDTAGYWAPAAYLNGVQLTPLVMRIYYLGEANADVETIPAGLQIVGGNPQARGAAENPHADWFCGETKNVKTPRMERPYDCTPYAAYSFVDGVVGIVDMPSCWDGVGLTREHVVYPVNGACPAGFGHVLPRLSQRIHYGVMNPLNSDGTVALSLASGSYFTFHSDFWNAWQQPRLDQLVADCLVAHVHCGAIGVAPEVEWTVQLGTTRLDVGNAIAVGSSGGAYVGGFTNLALPGQEHHRLSDAFVSRYAADGSPLWTRQFGTSGVDQILALAAGGSGVYVAGFTDGRLPGQTQVGGTDAFVRRYRPDGSVAWTRQFGTRRTDQALAIEVRGGSVYVAGRTDGVFRGQSRRGGVDAFVRRYDVSGRLAWTRQFGSAGSDEALGIAAGDGGVYVSGSVGGAFAGSGSGGLDAFLRRYEADGDRGWTRRFGTAGDDEAAGVDVRGTGVFVAGTAGGALGGEVGLGGADAFLRRYDADGVHVWTRQFGTPGTDGAAAVAAVPSGVHVAGTTDGAFVDQILLGETDGWVRKYRANGAEDWTRQLGTPDHDEALAVALDASGVYLTGLTHGTFEGQVNAGDRDVFVMKLRFT